MLAMEQAQRIKERSAQWREADSKLPIAMACWTALQELEEEGITLSEMERCDWLVSFVRIIARFAKKHAMRPSSFRG